MRGGVGLHTVRVSGGGFGAMFSKQPTIPASPNVKEISSHLQTTAPIAAARMVSAAPLQFMAPLVAPASGTTLGVRGDGTVGGVGVRTLAPSSMIGRAPRSVIPMGSTPGYVQTDPAQPFHTFNPAGPDGAAIDHSAPLEQQVGDASDGAQHPASVTMTSPDQVLPDSRTVGVTALDHPATTTGGHWVGGLVVAGVLVALAVGGVALFRAAV